MQLNDLLSPLTEEQKTDLRSWAHNIRSNFSAFVNRTKPVLLAVGRALAAVGKFAGEFLHAQEQFYLLFIKHGWPPPANEDLTLTEFFDLLEGDEGVLGSEAIQKRLDSTMLQMHDKVYLSKMIQKWGGSILLKERIHILLPAVKAHIRREYVLSIPVLLAQIEGIVVTAFRHAGWLNTETLIKYFKSITDDTGLIIKNKNRSIHEFVINILMAKFVHGDMPPTSPSRHAILHGADIEYPSEVNSLKLILLLENLRQLFGFEALEGSRVYHVYGCPTVRNSTKKRIIFTKAIKAQLHGYSGCQRCQAARFWFSPHS